MDGKRLKAKLKVLKNSKLNEATDFSLNFYHAL